MFYQHINLSSINELPFLKTYQIYNDPDFWLYNKRFGWGQLTFTLNCSLIWASNSSAFGSMCPTIACSSSSSKHSFNQQLFSSTEQRPRSQEYICVYKSPDTPAIRYKAPWPSGLPSPIQTHMNMTIFRGPAPRQRCPQLFLGYYQRLYGCTTHICSRAARLSQETMPDPASQHCEHVPRNINTATNNHDILQSIN